MKTKLLSCSRFKSFMKFVSFYFTLLFTLMVQPAKAQLFESGEILRAGADDANVLLKEYLKPFGRGFGADLNSGWITSAKPLEKFGFDLRITASVSFVPVNDRHFDVTDLDLNTVKLLDGPAETPTLFGDDTETSTLGANYENEELFSFKMPEGSDYHLVPAPMAQFSLGLPKSTQVTLRYTPTITIDDEYSINLFGIGGLIGLNSFLFGNRLPVDLSVQVGLMDFNADADFEVRPREDQEVENSYPNSQWNNQGVHFNSKTFTANILAGKSFSSLSLFGGVGYQYASTKIKTRGSYPIVVPKSDSDNSAPYEIQSLDDPINFTLDGVNKYHLLAGFQLKIAFVSLSAAYTIAEYPNLRAGVGITFDS